MSEKLFIVWGYDVFSSEYYEIKKCATIEEAEHIKSMHEAEAHKQGEVYQDTFSIEETTIEKYEQHKSREKELDETNGTDRLYRTFFE